MPGAAGQQAPPRARPGTHFVRDAASLWVVGPAPAAALVPPAAGAWTPRLHRARPGAGARELSCGAVRMRSCARRRRRGARAPGRRRAGEWPARGPGGCRAGSGAGPGGGVLRGWARVPGGGLAPAGGCARGAGEKLEQASGKVPAGLRVCAGVGWWGAVPAHPVWAAFSFPCGVV